MSHELPAGWVTTPLGDIAEINPRHPRDLDDLTPVSFAPMAAISESRPGFQFMQERPVGEVRNGFTHFAEGDVLFAKITPCMENGKGAVASGLRGGLGCGSTELHVLRPLAGISPHYLYRFLAQPAIRQKAKKNFTGTAGQARVPADFIKRLLIPLAPLPEQYRIVAKLEILQSKVEGCQKRLAKTLLLLKRFRQSVLAAACSGRLTADWRREKRLGNGDWKAFELRELLREPLSNGRSVADAVQGFPVLRLTCLKDGRIDLKERKIGAWTAETAKRFLIVEGDFLVSRGNGSLSYVGRGGLVEDKPDCVAFPDTMIRVRVRPEVIEPTFLRRVWNAKQLREQIESAAHTTAGIWKISQKDMEKFTLPVPSLGEQREIAHRVDALFALANQMEVRLKKAQAQVDSVASSLLSKAFRGDLVPTEAELSQKEGRDYEPASVLLARIRATRNLGEVGSKMRKAKMERRSAAR